MADSGGHWANLAEVQKTAQSELLQGVIDESPKRGGLITELPMKQSVGLSIKWNRSNARRSATRIAVGTELLWTDNVTYTGVESQLKIFYDQTPLNKFVRDTYGTHMNYEAQQFLEIRTGIVETIEDAFIYDDDDYNALHMEGLHHWAVDNTGTELDVDEGEGALSLMNLRQVEDQMKYGYDFILSSFILVRYLSQFYQEGGSGDDKRITAGSFIWQPSEIGRPMPWWNGKPIMRSDYMVSEQANTGAGSNARAKNTSGTAQYSLLLIKKGMDGIENDPGIKIAFGGDKHGNGEVLRPEHFDKLESFDASGIRLVSYLTTMLGSSLGIGRIYDITAALPTA